MITGRDEGSALTNTKKGATDGIGGAAWGGRMRESAPKC